MAGELVLRFRMLPWQAAARKAMDQALAKYYVWNCGIGSGKTVFGAGNMTEDFYGLDSGFAWWVCPEEFQVQRFAGDFGPRAQRLGWKYKEHPNIQCVNQHGAVLHGITAKNLNKIAAYHPKVMYVDEAAKLTKTQWDLIRIRAVHARKVVYMSTPRPNHWKRVLEDARQRRDGRWWGTTVTTAQAGLVDKSVIAEMRRDLPIDLFRQEFEAKIVKGAGSVFRHVDDCSKYEPARPGGKIKADLITQDVAKHQDFGWITVWAGMRVLLCVRLNHVPYKEQAKRVCSMAKAWGVPVVFDQTGVGEGYGEILQDEADRTGVDIDGFTFTAQNKPVLVQAAVKAFEDQTIELIDPEHGEPYDVMQEELVGFSMKRSGSGLSYTYSAPDGEHDDSVTTVLLRMSVDVLADGVAGMYQMIRDRQEREATGGESSEKGVDEDEAEEWYRKPAK